MSNYTGVICQTKELGIKIPNSSGWQITPVELLFKEASFFAWQSWQLFSVTNAHLTIGSRNLLLSFLIPGLSVLLLPCINGSRKFSSEPLDTSKCMWDTSLEFKCLMRYYNRRTFRGSSTQKNFMPERPFVKGSLIRRVLCLPQALFKVHHTPTWQPEQGPFSHFPGGFTKWIRLTSSNVLWILRAGT